MRPRGFCRNPQLHISPDDFRKKKGRGTNAGLNKDVVAASSPPKARQWHHLLQSRRFCLAAAPDFDSAADPAQCPQYKTAAHSAPEAAADIRLQMGAAHSPAPHSR